MKRSSQKGFTLLELLVAFAIMAIALGMIYRGMSGAARQAGEIADHQKAAWLAQSLLDSRDSLLEDGWNESGLYEGMSWLVQSQPYPTQVNTPEHVPLHEIRILVSWQADSKRNQLQINTLKPQRPPRDRERVK